LRASLVRASREIHSCWAAGESPEALVCWEAKKIVVKPQGIVHLFDLPVFMSFREVFQEVLLLFEAQALGIRRICERVAV